MKVTERAVKIFHETINGHKVIIWYDGMTGARTGSTDDKWFLFIKFSNGEKYTKTTMVRSKYEAWMKEFNEEMAS